jgi:hypothetical protein
MLDVSPYYFGASLAAYTMPDEQRRPVRETLPYHQRFPVPPFPHPTAGNLILIFALTTSPAAASARTKCFLALGEQHHENVMDFLERSVSSLARQLTRPLLTMILRSGGLAFLEFLLRFDSSFDFGTDILPTVTRYEKVH